MSRRFVITMKVAPGADITADPDTWAGLYEDITGRWRLSSNTPITTGQPDQTDTLDAGHLSPTLNNRDGALIPRNPMGPYFGLIGTNTPFLMEIEDPTDSGADPAVLFAGFVSTWPLRWDRSMADINSPIAVRGVLDRLRQGTPPDHSPIRRHVTSLRRVGYGLLDYWPCEDEGDSTTVASAVPGRPPALPAGDVDFAALDPSTSPGAASRRGTKAIPDLRNGGQIGGAVRAGTSSPVEWSVRFFGGLYTFGFDETCILASIDIAGGTYIRIDFVLEQPSGDTAIIGYNSAYSPTTLVEVATIQFIEVIEYRLDARQNGGNIDFVLMLKSQPGRVYEDSASIAGTLGRPSRFTGNPASLEPDAGLTVSHPEIWNLIERDATRPLSGEREPHQTSAWIFEFAHDRLIRICGENGIPITVDGVEGFESSDLSMTFTGTWARDNTSPTRSGQWVYRSAAIGNSATSDAVLTVPTEAVTLSGWYSVSSEEGADFFRILVDGVLAVEKSGEIGWARFSLDVSQASTVTFRYTKSAGTAAGEDAAWIDDLTWIEPTVMGSQPDATTADLIAETVRAEQGILAEYRFGFRYTPRQLLFNQSAALVLDIEQDHLRGESPQPVDDDQRLRNRARVSREGGSSAVAENEESIARSGPYDAGTITLRLADDSRLADYAEWFVRQGTVAAMSWPVIEINLAGSPELITPWLACKRGDLIELRGLPPETGGDTALLMLLGATQTPHPERDWSVTINCVPAAPWFVAEADGDQVVASDGAALTAGIDADDLSAQLSTSGDLWSTDAADYPVDIAINGERITLSAVAGAASPQTLTFTARAVNGVVRSHDAGSPVDAWDPAYAAL